MRSFHLFIHPTSVLTTFLSCIACLSLHATPPVGWQDLWPSNAIPGPPPPSSLRENESKLGRLTDTAVPQYQVFTPKKTTPDSAAVIIFPGGGYTILAYQHEGLEYAKWLTDRGITAILVKYRVSADDAAQFQYPAPLLDARRAIRTARSNATSWHINPKKIGVMGSSAGGHLASMCATLWNAPIPSEPNDALFPVSCRPDFAMLIYPVISIADPWTHAGSKRRLLGPTPPPDLAEQLSTHRRVNPETPPCFLVHAADDPGVPLRNSLEFAAACADHHVPVVLHVFAQGKHGFGLRGIGDSSAWPTLLERWLQSTIQHQPSQIPNPPPGLTN